MSHAQSQTEGSVRWEGQAWGVTYEEVAESDGSVTHNVIFTHPDGNLNVMTDYKLTDERMTHKSYIQWGGENEVSHKHGSPI